MRGRAYLLMLLVLLASVVLPVGITAKIEEKWGGGYVYKTSVLPDLSLEFDEKYYSEELKWGDARLAHVEVWVVERWYAPKYYVPRCPIQRLVLDARGDVRDVARKLIANYIYFLSGIKTAIGLGKPEEAVDLLSRALPAFGNTTVTKILESALRALRSGNAINATKLIDEAITKLKYLMKEFEDAVYFSSAGLYASLPLLSIAIDTDEKLKYIRELSIGDVHASAAIDFSVSESGAVYRSSMSLSGICTLESKALAYLGQWEPETARELAELVGCSVSLYARIEYGAKVGNVYVNVATQAENRTVDEKGITLISNKAMSIEISIQKASTTTESSSGGGLSGGQIINAVLLVAIVSGAAWWFLKKRRVKIGRKEEEVDIEVAPEES